MNSNNSSSTAASVGAIRYAQTNDASLPKLGPDKLVNQFLPLKYNLLGGPLWKVGRWMVRRKIPGMYEWIFCRTQYYDSLVNQVIKSGVKQIVICGAGYDTRAIRFKDLAAKENVEFFELDFPSTQKRKLSHLKKNQNAQVKFLPIDFTSTKISDVLKSSSISLDKPTLFYFEGVVMYLSVEELQETLVDIKNTFTKSGQIAFDFCSENVVIGKDHSLGAMETYKHVKKVGEPLKWGIAPEKISEFLRRLGFTCEEVLSPKDVEALFLNDKSAQMTSRVSGHNHLVKAKW